MRHGIRNIASVGVAAILSTMPGQLYSQSGSAAVNTQMSTYLAGGNAYTTTVNGGGGLSPFEIMLTAGTGRILRVNASGTAFFCPNNTCGTASPDGPSIGGTNLAASGSISGIRASTSGFLAGVFLGDPPNGAAPSSLDFRNPEGVGTDFSSLSGLGLGQQFFIGDGFKSGNVQQLFYVPDGATRLYFGIADGSSFIGDPGFYADNVGTYTARYSITSATTVPEPSSYALVGAGLVALFFVRRRRTA